MNIKAKIILLPILLALSISFISIKSYAAEPDRPHMYFGSMASDMKAQISFNGTKMPMIYHDNRGYHNSLMKRTCNEKSCGGEIYVFDLVTGESYLVSQFQYTPNANIVSYKNTGTIDVSYRFSMNVWNIMIQQR